MAQKRSKKRCKTCGQFGHTASSHDAIGLHEHEEGPLEQFAPEQPEPKPKPGAPLNCAPGSEPKPEPASTKHVVVSQAKPKAKTTTSKPTSVSQPKTEPVPTKHVPGGPPDPRSSIQLAQGFDALPAGPLSQRHIVDPTQSRMPAGPPADPRLDVPGVAGYIDGKVETLDKVLLSMTPIAATVHRWGEMSPTERFISVAADSLFFAPLGLVRGAGKFLPTIPKVRTARAENAVVAAKSNLDSQLASAAENAVVAVKSNLKQVDPQLASAADDVFKKMRKLGKAVGEQDVAEHAEDAYKAKYGTSTLRPDLTQAQRKVLTAQEELRVQAKQYAEEVKNFLQRHGGAFDDPRLIDEFKALPDDLVSTTRRMAHGALDATQRLAQAEKTAAGAIEKLNRTGNFKVATDQAVAAMKHIDRVGDEVSKLLKRLNPNPPTDRDGRREDSGRG